jgi:cation transport ATPase
MSNAAEITDVEPGLQADQRLLDRGWLKIGAGLAVAAQAMVFSLAVNLSEVDNAWAYAVVHGILILAALGSLYFLGGELVRSAWEALRARKISIDLLFLVTLAGALGGSLIGTFTKTGSVYYEVVAVLIVVHTAGKMLGARSRVSALRAVDRTREKFDVCEVVSVMRDGNREDRSGGRAVAAASEGVASGRERADGGGVLVQTRVKALKGGEIVRVAPGAAIAVDGEIVSGRGYVQETSMTGEWQPMSRGPGERVLAGTYSVDGSFEVRADGGARKLDAILSEVEKARMAPSRLQAHADRLMAWFLPLVVGVSVATFAGWWFYAPWERALFNAMAVLLVACPCAMGLATPVAVWGGLARLAKFGLVARTGDFLEALARVNVVCLDKTGTLSTEALEVKVWQIEPEFAGKEAWLRAAVAAVEEGIAHPVAAALRKNGLGAGGRCHPLDDNVVGAQGSGAELYGKKCHVLRDTFPGKLEVSERRIVPGLGVVAELGGAGISPLKIAVGEPEIVAEQGAEAVGDAEKCHVLRDTFPGKRVCVFVDGKLAVRVELAERWRAGMVEALAELRELGVEAEVLSGDPEAERVLGVGAGLGSDVGAVLRRDGLAVRERVEANADADDSGDRGVKPLLQVRIRGGMTPQTKQVRVEELVKAGRCVAFFGDGVNDAAAMSAAEVSVAMRGGSELARASAMAVFAGDDWRFLPQAIRVARATRRGIRANLVFASVYNIIGMALAAGGVLHPVAAALLMVGSSVLVSVRAMRSSSA